VKGRILVQNLADRRFLAADRSWIADCFAARVFDHTSIALIEALKRRGEPLQVVWCFRHPLRSLYFSVHRGDTDRVALCQNCPCLEEPIRGS
jgi:hypothetical protein